MKEISHLFGGLGVHCSVQQQVISEGKLTKKGSSSQNLQQAVVRNRQRNMRNTETAVYQTIKNGWG